MSEPILTYPPQLPVSARHDEIIAALEANQVVIIAGETGSGKTTQIPKMCLELGRGGEVERVGRDGRRHRRRRMIGHTQPRRIAARTIAERLAAETGTELGDVIGWQVRFTDHTGPDTRVKVMTDGILLAEIRRDRRLLKYDTIIIDEAHERSLNIDFLLGYLKRLLPERPDLKLVITSATIDVERFSRHFDDAPVIEVSGRTYPVEIRWRPPERDESTLEALLRATDELMLEPDGDVLVFLPTEADIRETTRALEGRHRFTEVLPLFGRLSAAEQHRVFEPGRAAGVRRRFVLATNVAETSLTVPGIRYVIDTGTARISRYSTRSRVQRLPIEPISQASANQRAGRCGRVADGVCIRLYAEDDFAGRPEYTDPEILRTNLASVILQMALLRVGAIDDFPFIQPPEARAIASGMDTLVELGAILPERRHGGGRGHAGQGRGAGRVGVRLTDIGRRIARVPIDPRLARMILAAEDEGVAHEVTVIVAALTVQDPRERPRDRRQAADEMHARFADPTSDFLGLLRLWEHLEQQRAELSSSAFRRMCRREFLNHQRVREWVDLVHQLERLRREGEHRGGRNGHGDQDGHGRRRDGGEPSPANAAGGTAAAPAVAALRERPATAEAGRGQAGDGEHDGDRRRSHDGRDRSGGRGRGDRGRGGRGRGAHDPVAEAAGARQDAIHRSLMAGLLSQLGVRDDAHGDYLGSRGTRFRVFPGSALFKRPPAEIMTAELVETGRLWARVNARVDLAWAEALAGDLAKHSFAEPRWSARREQVVATERVTLYGVPIVAGRLADYARVDPAAAREIFIRSALVEGDWHTRHTFFAENQRLRERVEELENRSRRRDIAVDDETLFAFYDRRIPEHVTSGRAFDRWWRDERRKHPDLLTLRLADVADPDAAAVDEADYPSVWRQGDLTLSVSYRFDPGSDTDGVNVDVPLPLLARLRPDGFDWLVPGLREDLAVALIRTLPKPVRRHVVPAADWARRALATLPALPDGRPFTTALGDALRGLTGMPIPADAWDGSRVPAHLRVTFRVLDDRGRALSESTDLAALQREHRFTARAAVARHSTAAERTGIVAWDDALGTLPVATEQRLDGNVVRGWPALVDETKSVALRTLATPAEALVAHWRGVRRLVALTVPLPTEYVLGHLTPPEKLTLAASPYPSPRAVVEDAALAIIDDELARLVTGAEATDAPAGDAADPADAAPVADRVRAVRLAGRLPRDRDAFVALADRVNARMADGLFEATGAVARVLGARRDCERALKKTTSLALLGAVTDVREHLDELVHDGFVHVDGLARLPHVRRYLDGLALRLRKLERAPGRDNAWRAQAEQARALYREAGGTLPGADWWLALVDDRARVLDEARWMLEELQVGLWAQELGTAAPASLTRLRRLLAG